MNLSLFILFLGICFAAPPAPTNPVYAVKYAGTEVINLNNPSIAYAANLVYGNPSPSKDEFATLWFTADKSSPNLYYAQFNPEVSDNAFWVIPQSPFDDKLAPFLSIDVINENIIGIAYPNNWTQASSHPSLIVQSAYVGGETNVIRQSAPLDFTFFSTVIDSAHDSSNKSKVYLAGWSTGGFVVVRATVTLGNRGDPTIFFDQNTDVVTISELVCYDLFDTVNKPKLYLTATYLIVAVPGRCAALSKFVLPTSDSLQWNTVVPTTFIPTEVNTKYMSSSVFDPDHELIYYFIQIYNQPGGTLFAFNAASFQVKTRTNKIDDVTEAFPILVLGNEENSGKLVKYIFIACSGSNKIKRFMVSDDFSLSANSTAVLDSSINAISSAVYIRPFFYYTTYEPDAKIVRITKTNFCADWCGDNGYCELGRCNCRDGFEIDPTDPAKPCRPKDVVSNEIKVRQSQGASAALGVLFVFSLLAAIAGWFLWWKGKHQATYNPV